MKKLFSALLFIFLLASQAFADNVWVPTFPLRLTNGYYLRITNGEGTTNRIRCIGIITSGTGVGTTVITEVNLSASSTGDCQPGASVEWDIHAIVHEGAITIGSYDGSNLVDFATDAANPTTANIAQIDFLCESAPGTPASGYGSAWCDSTDKILKLKDDAGSTSVTVIPDAGASNNYLTAINADGSVSKAQPSSSNLSDATALKVRPCEIHIGDAGSASSALANDNDTHFACTNTTGATLTISGVKCAANDNTGAPTADVVITGGSTVLSSAAVCGNNTWGTGATVTDTTQANGESFTIDITPGGTAKEIVVLIERTL